MEVLKIGLSKKNCFQNGGMDLQEGMILNRGDDFCYP